jgi:hypothetical protein
MKIPKPDYVKIKEYLPDTNSEWFEGVLSNGKNISTGAFEYYCLKMGEPQFDDENMYFFWAYYASKLEHYIWAKEVGLYSEQNKRNKQLAALKEFLAPVITGNVVASQTKKDKVLESLTIKVSALNNPSLKPQKIEISSHMLLYDLIGGIEEKISNQLPAVQLNTATKESYFKQFVQATRPLYLYLKNGKEDIAVFDEVEQFADSLGFIWSDVTEWPREYIKARYLELTNIE